MEARSRSHKAHALAVQATLLLAACYSPEINERQVPVSQDEGQKAAELWDPPAADEPYHPGLEHRLYRLQAAFRRGGQTATQDLARGTGVRMVEGAILVQLNLRPGVHVDDVTDRALAVHGARVTARGFTVLEALVPPGELTAVVDGVPGVAWLSAPLEALPDVGAHVTEGVARVQADRFHCRGVDGKGVHLALIDIGFDKWSKALASGELPGVSGSPSDFSSTHGTSCAEVVADVAPGVIIHPLKVSTLATMEQWIKNDLPSTKIQIISRSLSSLGGGFGGGGGAWCSLAAKVKAGGVLWVNSAGNYGGGNFYRGKFKDSDKDGWHEFSGTAELNKFSFTSTSRITMQLDWDDYPSSAEDYDLYVYRWSGSKWVTYGSSKSKQTGTQAPREYLSLSKPPGGDYAFAIFRKKAAKANMTLRLFKYSGGKTLQYHQAAGSINTVSACADVLTVGAIPQDRYATGPQNPSSSQGPTWDGRVKPDLAGPTIVDTLAKAKFGGTSAATPHVSGAVALYMHASGSDPLTAAKNVLKDTIPMGSPAPNNIYGQGRMVLNPTRAGWACKPGANGTCTTKCGSQGTRACQQACAWGQCVAPKETCNGKDDDCDGQKDNGFTCVAGARRGCNTHCNSQGSQTCTATCGWGACKPHAETCNGKDDDCDGQVDEGGVCQKAPDGGGPGAGEEEGCSCGVGDGGGESFLLWCLLLLALVRPRRS